MVQINQPNLNFNVRNTVNLKTTQVDNTEESKKPEKPPKAEIKAVYKTRSMWNNGNTARIMVLHEGIQPGDIVICLDATLRFLGFDENGYGVYE